MTSPEMNDGAGSLTSMPPVEGPHSPRNRICGQPEPARPSAPRGRVRAMVRLIPEQPTFATPSEREVWERLRDGLGPDDVLMANLRLTDETKDHEADLVVLHARRRGASCSRSRAAASGATTTGWWQTAARRSRADRPGRAGRARPSTPSATTSRATRGGTTATTSRGGTAIVMPYSEFPDEFATHRLPALVAARPRRPGRPGRAGPRERRAARRRASRRRPTTTSRSSSTSSPAGCPRRTT